MPKYINADEFRFDLQKHIVSNNNDYRAFVDTDFLSLVDDMPAADVQEVVLCKDCKHCRKMNTPNLLFFCERRNIYTEEVGGKDFCSRGERIDGKDGDEK